METTTLTTIPVDGRSDCLGSNFTKSEQTSYNTASIVVLSILTGLFCFLGFTGNVIVVVAILVNRVIKKHLQNLYLLSLAVADALLVVLVVPFSLTNELLGYWPFGDVYCRIYLSLDILLCTASICNICCIGLDRYVSVKYPATYQAFRTLKRIRLVMLVIWIYAAAVSLLPFSGYTEIIHGETHEECFINDSSWFIVLSCSLSFFLPTCIICPVYIRIYLIGKRLEAAKRARQNKTKHMKLPSSSVYFKKRHTANKRKEDKKIVPPCVRRGRQLCITMHEENGNSFATTNIDQGISDNNCVDPSVLVEEKGHLKVLYAEPTTFTSLLSANRDELLRSDKSINAESKASICIANHLSDEDDVNIALALGGCCKKLCGVKKRKNNNAVDYKFFNRKCNLSSAAVEETKTQFLIHDSSVSEANAKVCEMPKQRKHNLQATSHAGACQSRRERRFVCIICVVTGCYMFCWLPFFTTYLIYAICRTCCINKFAFKVFFWLGYLNSGINPVLYTIFNQDFRKAFKQLFQVCINRKYAAYHFQ